MDTVIIREESEESIRSDTVCLVEEMANIIAKTLLAKHMDVIMKKTKQLPVPSCGY
jgi:hypothetical protein